MCCDISSRRVGQQLVCLLLKRLGLGGSVPSLLYYCLFLRLQSGLPLSKFHDEEIVNWLLILSDTAQIGVKMRTKARTKNKDLHASVPYLEAFT